MDWKLFREAMEVVGIKPIVIDEETKSSPFSPLHATLRKCKCGYIASSHMVQKHIEDLLKTRSDVKAFWKYHGEVPLNQQEGENFQNRKWLEGTPRGYND